MITKYYVVEENRNMMFDHEWEEVSRFIDFEKAKANANTLKKLESDYKYRVREEVVNTLYEI